MVIDDAELDQVLSEITTARELELEDQLTEVDRRLDAIGAELNAMRDRLAALLDKVEANDAPKRPRD